MQKHRRPNTELVTGSSALPVAAMSMAIGIFVVDTITYFEIAVAVLYVAVVVMSTGFCRKRGVVLVAFACMVLTLASVFLNRTGTLQSGLINSGISLLAIAATTILILKIESAEVMVHEARLQLAHVARVTTMGELTASIAHEIGQPLAAIETSASACLRRLASQPPNVEKAKETVQRMINDANRASEIIRHVRNLAQGAPPQTERFSINTAIRETLALIESDIEANRISLRTQLADGLPLVVGERIQLQQVILNLVRNAVEAINAARNEPREIMIRTAKQATNELLVAVCDSGQGIDAAKLDHVYEAFYTTKREGMGLGLTISRSIVETLGGRLSAAPNMPRGAIFQFTIPTQEATA